MSLVTALVLLSVSWTAHAGEPTDPVAELPVVEGPAPLSAADKERLAELARELPRHGLPPLSAPPDEATDPEWLKLARRLAQAFEPDGVRSAARNTLLDSRPLAPAIDALVPTHRRYRALMELLVLYSRRSATSPPQIPETRYSVRVGVTAPEVGLLRDRLRVEGYGDEGVTGRLRDYFDDRLKRALQSWQKDKSLPPTVVLDTLTRKRLNAPIEEPLADVLLALDRFRAVELRHDEGVHLIVHVNDYALTVERDGRGELAMPVVVGKNTDKDQTPMLSAPLYAIVVNPSWNVPTRLVDERLRPSVNDIPELLIDKGYEVTVEATGKWKVKMGPGPDNPLGKLKFLLSGTQSIYLHDTPQRNAFGKDTRALSAGCVRLSDPAALARYLLPGKELPLEEAMTYNTTPTTFQVGPFATHLVYQTVLAEDGRLVRFPDIYERDAAALAAIDPARIDKVTAALRKLKR
jgi:murein L,D-transpeptidase YcbB/YkuD